MGVDSHTRSIGVLELIRRLAIEPPSSHYTPHPILDPLIPSSAHPHSPTSSHTPHTRSRRSSRDPKCPIGKAKPPGHPIIEIPHISPPFHCTWYPVHSGAIYIDITYFLTLYTEPVRCGISVRAAAVVDSVTRDIPYVVCMKKIK